MNNKIYKKLNNFHLLFIETSKTINNVLLKEDLAISREQIGVFKLLNEHRQLTVKEIADAQGVFKTAVSKRIKKLEDRGFVIRVQSKDKREKLIQLTNEGQLFFDTRQEKLYTGLIQELNLKSEDIEKINNHVNEIKNIIDERKDNNEWKD